MFVYNIMKLWGRQIFDGAHGDGGGRHFDGGWKWINICNF